MEENKSCTKGQNARSNCRCGAGPFLLGLVVALAFGWWVFPDVMFSEQPQPILFKHSIHVEKNELDCAKCHFLRDDGSFSGTPNIDTCVECHDGVINTKKPGSGATAEEKALYKSEEKLVTEYIATGTPIQWQVSQYQPDNVFFSHAAHFSGCYNCHLTMKGKFDLGTPDTPNKLCGQCHVSYKERDAMTGVDRNIMTGYSKTTMKMWECESCHAHPGHYENDGKGRTSANNACFTCHK